MSINENLLTAYLQSLKLKGHRERGIIGLRTRLPLLFKYLGSEGLKLSQVGVKEAQSYQGAIIEEGRKRGAGGYSTRTVAAYVFAASNFFEYLKEEGLVASNPFGEIKKIRVEKVLPKHILKEKELSSLLDSLARFDKEEGLKKQVSAYKLHVVAELQYATGLRVSEVAELHTEDIDFKRGTIKVRYGKGGTERLAYLNEYALSILKLYVTALRPLVLNGWHKDCGSLLFGASWSTFSRVVNRQLQRAAGTLDLGPFTSHGFRHALGYHLLRAGCKVRYIQEILGHKLLRNTEIYTKVDKEDLKEVLDTYHPRKFKGKDNSK